jgi:hypothetical protein
MAWSSPLISKLQTSKTTTAQLFHAISRLHFDINSIQIGFHPQIFYELFDKISLEIYDLKPEI